MTMENKICNPDFIRETITNEELAAVSSDDASRTRFDAGDVDRAKIDELGLNLAESERVRAKLADTNRVLVKVVLDSDKELAVLNKQAEASQEALNNALALFERAGVMREPDGGTGNAVLDELGSLLDEHSEAPKVSEPVGGVGFSLDPIHAPIDEYLADIRPDQGVQQLDGWTVQVGGGKLSKDGSAPILDNLRRAAAAASMTVAVQGSVFDSMHQTVDVTALFAPDSDFSGREDIMMLRDGLNRWARAHGCTLRYEWPPRMSGFEGEQRQNCTVYAPPGGLDRVIDPSRVSVADGPHVMVHKAFLKQLAHTRADRDKLLEDLAMARGERDEARRLVCELECDPDEGGCSTVPDTAEGHGWGYLFGDLETTPTRPWREVAVELEEERDKLLEENRAARTERDDGRMMVHELRQSMRGLQREVCNLVARHDAGWDGPGHVAQARGWGDLGHFKADSVKGEATPRLTVLFSGVDCNRERGRILHSLLDFLNQGDAGSRHGFGSHLTHDGVLKFHPVTGPEERWVSAEPRQATTVEVGEITKLALRLW